MPAPYLARNRWVQVKDFTSLSKLEWERLFKQCNELVFEKLPAKVRKVNVQG